MTDTLIIAALGLGAFWFLAKRSQARDAISQKAIEVVGGIKPTVSISNVEAIEERQVWVFQPSVDPSVKWRTGGSSSGPVVDIASAYASLKPTQTSGTFIEGRTLRLIDMGESGYNVYAFMELYPGGFYDSMPKMGTLPFNDLRLEFTGTQHFARSSPIDFRWTCLVPDEVWKKWWVTRIATVAEQEEAGGIILVPPTMK